MNFWKLQANSLLSFWRWGKKIGVQTIDNHSFVLNREIRIDIYLPPGYRSSKKRFFPLVLFNDGQDLPRMEFRRILETQINEQNVPPLIAVGIYASEQRLREYGTARQPDYKGRGDKASIYAKFIIEELMPYLQSQYRISEQAADRAIAGFSLGGLSAFDIGWANPEIFGTIGVFSGALWWRWSAVNPRNPDADRIMHDIVRKTNKVDKDQYFWFQTGTLDEASDRNKNGVIDSIDDTLALICEIQAKGFRDESIRYLEIEDGQHDPQTWGEAMPDFLGWAFVTEGS